MAKRFFDMETNAAGAPGQDPNKGNGTQANGMVLEALPNAQFRIELEGGKLILAYLSGKMHLHKIRVLIGDKVTVQLDQYGERGRIIRRL